MTGISWPPQPTRTPMGWGAGLSPGLPYSAPSGCVWRYRNQPSLRAQGGLARGKPRWPDPPRVLGVLSLILWSLIVVISIKYCIFILRADNRGEGGIIALLALLGVRRVAPGSWRVHLVVMGLVGTSLLYADGAITPAISVLSAVEGLTVDAHGFEHYVVPITVVILIGLFSVQRMGTAWIGRIFGPFMLFWFVVLGLLGLGSIVKAPGVLAAINPYYALSYILDAGPASPWPCSRPCSCPSPVVRRSMPIWATSAGFRSVPPGSRSCCLLWCSTTSARVPCC